MQEAGSANHWGKGMIDWIVFYAVSISNIQPYTGGGEGMIQW